MQNNLVLIPGFANNELAWEHQIEALSDLCDIHVYIMEKETTRIEMVESILNAAPSRFVLAGHSMGGWIAQAVAAIAPDRVEKLILLNTWAGSHSEMMQMQRQICDALKQGGLAQVLQQQLPTLIHPSRHGDTALHEQIQKMASSFPVEVLVQQLEAMLSDYSSLHHHLSIAAPTMVVHSRDDALFPHEHHALNERIKRAQLAALDACGHASLLEKPHEVSELMRSFIE
jgi:pimeloyl-ACP methyl ester carboxylesterase